MIKKNSKGKSKEKIKGELKMGSSEWEVIGNAFKLNTLVEIGKKKEKAQAFNELTETIKSTNLEKTQLVVESYSDVLGTNGKKVNKKMSKRILKALAEDLGIELSKESSSNEKESD